MKVEIVSALPDHIQSIADNIRDADKQEIYDYCLLCPLEALEQSLANSTLVWTGMVDDVPICMFGASEVSLLTGVGLPWLIGTKGIEEHSVVFLRRCRPYIIQMAKRFKRLENYVSASNILAISWLKWLGFTFGPEEEVGLFKKSFKKFWM